MAGAMSPVRFASSLAEFAQTTTVPIARLQLQVLPATAVVGREQASLSLRWLC